MYRDNRGVGVEKRNITKNGETEALNGSYSSNTKHQKKKIKKNTHRLKVAEKVLFIETFIKRNKKGSVNKKNNK